MVLNEHDDKRLQSIVEDIATESFGMNPEADYNDYRWLVGKLLDSQIEIEELRLELEQLRGIS